MGQKDIAEKVLESYNDVFADIVNGLVFKGKKVVKEDDLQEMSPISTFKASRKYHKQERDVAKLWKENGIRVALCGIENQTTVDSSMCCKRRATSYQQCSKLLCTLFNENTFHNTFMCNNIDNWKVLSLLTKKYIYS